MLAPLKAAKACRHPISAKSRVDSVALNWRSTCLVMAIFTRPVPQCSSLDYRPDIRGLWIECRLWGVLSPTFFFWETATMRSVLAVILSTYLIGVGIVLSPTIRSTPASAMSASIGRRCPRARMAGEARSGRLNWERYYRSRP